MRAEEYRTSPLAVVAAIFLVVLTANAQVEPTVEILDGVVVHSAKDVRFLVDGADGNPPVDLLVSNLLVRLSEMQQRIELLEANQATLTDRIRTLEQTHGMWENCTCAVGFVLRGLHSNGSCNCVADRDTTLRLQCNTGEVISSVNGANGQCVQMQRPLVSQNCASGSALVGILPDGVTNCSPFIRSNPAVGTCPVGQVVAAIQSDGRLICIDYVTADELQQVTSQLIVDTAVAINSTINSAVPGGLSPLLNCMRSGLVYDTVTKRCVPTFVHQGCPSTPPTFTTACANSTHDSKCQVYCPVGFRPSNNITGMQNLTCGPLASWLLERDLSPAPTCVPVPCPVGSAGTAPNCLCPIGFRGNVTWNRDTSAWSYPGSCSLDVCPVGATGAPNCICSGRYEGAISWSFNTQTWSTCTPKPCPTNGIGAPDCVCNTANSFGTLTFNNLTNTWDGTCTPKIENVLCAFADEGGTTRAQCSAGLLIRDVTFSCYGRSSRCTRDCSCGRVITNEVKAACMNRQICDISATNGAWGDPCGGFGKAVEINFICRNF